MSSADSALANGTAPRNVTSATVVISFSPPDRSATAASAVSPSSHGTGNRK
jgi:hypothetical protein